MGTPPTACWPSIKYFGDSKASEPVTMGLLSGKALYVMSKVCLLRAEEETLTSSLLQLSNLYLQSRVDDRFLFISLSSSLSISILSCKQLGPKVLKWDVKALPFPVFSKTFLNSCVYAMPLWLWFSGAVSLDRDDHFLRGLKSFMSREESRSPLPWSPSVCMRVVLHLEPSDGRDSLCLETEALELDGITWAVGRVTNDRLGLKDSGPLEVEWSSTLSEQEVPMPVSPLSDVMLCLRIWLFRGLDGTAVACHNDSLPGNHADE